MGTFGLKPYQLWAMIDRHRVPVRGSSLEILRESWGINIHDMVTDSVKIGKFEKDKFLYITFRSGSTLLFCKDGDSVYYAEPTFAEWCLYRTGSEHFVTLRAYY